VSAYSIRQNSLFDMRVGDNQNVRITTVKHLFNSVILSLLLIGVISTVHAQTLTPEQWQQDLAFLSLSISSKHPNPFHAISEESFGSRVDKLHEKIPNLNDDEIIVEMAALVAMLQDGHTQFQGVFQFFTGHYPFRLEVFSDGIFVRSAPRALKGTIGARLLRLGQVDVEEAFVMVASVTPHDNDMTLKNWVPSIMVIPEILHAQKITIGSDRARFVFADRSGQEIILDLAPLESEDSPDWIDSSAGVKQPLYLQHRKDNYWHQYLEDSQILFVQYNRVQDAPGETVAEFFARISQLMLNLPIKSIVLDVRFNSGGNNYLNAPVVEWVKSTMQGSNVNFYVIIGRGTFSAAQTLVTRLEATTDVILVGEPTGGSPNHFGDSIKFQLPHSDLTLAVSSLYHNDAPGDNRTTIEPQLLSPLSSKDYFSGRDPALEAILSAQ
jgi:hypothetical protein